MSTVTANETTVEIKGALYAVEPVDAGFAGVAAVRLTKLSSGESYDVVLGHDGAMTCECPDFVVRHADKGTHCKHCKAALEHGLVVAPVSGGSPVAIAPITEKDVKRASYFGLKLPRPAPVV